MWNLEMLPSELKAYRKRLRMTQHELAEMLELTPSAISRWERGSRPIPRYLEIVLRHLLADQVAGSKFRN